MTILNVGSINWDQVLRVPHFQAPGQTLQANSVEVGLGGKGPNQTVAILRAGPVIVKRTRLIFQRMAIC
jgi:ribokinase